MEAREFSSTSVNGIPEKPDRTIAPDELRSVVERRFLAMNEAHDRIRIETLNANQSEKGLIRE